MDETYFSQNFQYISGQLYCEGQSVKDIQHQLYQSPSPSHTPFFLYSKAQICQNVAAYMEPLSEKFGESFRLNYAVKANMNPHIVKLLRDLGCSVTLVSGLELKMALDVGFHAESMILNGNGKRDWEVEMAVMNGCMLNIDSLFNLAQTVEICEKNGTTARVLLRVNPDIDAKVHHYVSTGLEGTKFGVGKQTLDNILAEINNQPRINLVGLHCHLGSTIEDVQVFRECGEAMIGLYRQLKEEFPALQYLNLGGGLGLPFRKHAWRTSENSKPDQSMATAGEVVTAIREVITADDVTLILEPGRTLVGDAGILVTSVLGVKENGTKKYIVVDASMTEAIRPALYGAYHHIDLAEPGCCSPSRHVYQVVGPVCESADFLGKDRYLATPDEGCTMAVFDVGAYCASMASNYNMRVRPAEVMVDGQHLEIIRRPDTFEDIMAPYMYNICGSQTTS